MTLEATPNYLDTVAQAPTSAATPVAKTAPAPLTNQVGETISPQLLTTLESYIQKQVADSVTQGLRTLLPDIVELARNQVEKQQTTTAIAPRPPAALPHRDDFDNYVPGKYQGARPGDSDMGPWFAIGGVVVTMAALAGFSMFQGPQAQTVRQSEQLSQSQQVLAEQLIQSNQQVLNSRQRCGDFSLICNIKDQ